MPTSEARIRANRQNAAKSTGPKTPGGKEASRANALKHGLTGGGVVLPERDAAEVERLATAFLDEFQVEGEVGRMLADRMATMAVRMKRSVEQESAALGERVRRMMDEFEAPEGIDDPAEVDRLRTLAGKIALFDDSKSACLARKYEAATERCFYRTLKELQQLNGASRPARAHEATKEIAKQAKSSLARLGSFLPAPSKPPVTPAKPISTPSKRVLEPVRPALAGWDPFAVGQVDVPIAIGKLR
jgi:hypothetical protein